MFFLSFFYHLPSFSLIATLIEPTLKRHTLITQQKLIELWTFRQEKNDRRHRRLHISEKPLFL
jgi:hypothetical protein